MAASSRPSEMAVQRQRKSHKKSRLGCRNCKLRRIKCDETRPACAKCLSFRISCNYDPTAPDLQVSFNSVDEVDLPSRLNTCSLNQTLLGRINSTLRFSFARLPGNGKAYQLDICDLERLNRFQTRTILTIGSANSAPGFQNEVIRLACLHPYVMHVIMNLTAIHDRLLLPSSEVKPSPLEIYHSYQAASLFNQTLSLPIRPSDRDALWAAAALLGTIAISSIEAISPDESWPLKTSSPSDLEWLRLSEGKEAIWNIADPLRPDSAFRFLAADLENSYAYQHAPDGPPQDIPAPFIALCDLTPESTCDNNPYHTALHYLAPLLRMTCNSTTIVRFLCFTSHMHPEFRSRLDGKDPRALLLMAYWYTKVQRYQWWIARRAFLECHAICIYLERYHASETGILELLIYPKMNCGLLL